MALSAMEGSMCDKAKGRTSVIWRVLYLKHDNEQSCDFTGQIERNEVSVMHTAQVGLQRFQENKGG